jgi:hypothetical protein
MWSLPALAAVFAWGGCVTTQPVNPVGVSGVCENPLLAPVSDADYVWEQVVDVVDDDFKILRERPIRRSGNELLEGRLETVPKVGATVFEPWHRDSVGRYERTESTLQSIRRQAVVRVIPDSQGFLVDVAVFKELEDVARPEHATAGAATLRYDSSLTRVREAAGDRPINEGWILLGRDVMLEQRILAKLRERFRPADISRFSMPSQTGPFGPRGGGVAGG